MNIQPPVRDFFYIYAHVTHVHTNIKRGSGEPLPLLNETKQWISSCTPIWSSPIGLEITCICGECVLLSHRLARQKLRWHHVWHRGLIRTHAQALFHLLNNSWSNLWLYGGHISDCTFFATSVASYKWHQIRGFIWGNINNHGTVNAILCI